MRAKRVEAGVLDGRVPPLWLPAEGGVRLADGRDGGGALRLVLGVIGFALRSPDGSEETGHGGEAAGPREVWLWRTENMRSLDTWSCQQKDLAACSYRVPISFNSDFLGVDC